jgi:hypothetical protein
MHRPLAPRLRGFAQGAENTEVSIFSIAVERTAMENHPAANAAKTATGMEC